MKRKCFCIVFLLIIILSNIFVIHNGPVLFDKNIRINLVVECDFETDIQFFYSDGIFDIEHSETKKYKNTGEPQSLSFEIPTNYSAWRIDYGNCPDKVTVNSLELKIGKYSKSIDLDMFSSSEHNDISKLSYDNNKCIINIQGEDPYSILDMNKIGISDFLNEAASKRTLFVKIIVCFVIDLFAILFLLKNAIVFDVINELLGQKDLIFNLAKNDFKTRYVGSYLGVVWAFIRPIITVVVYWFVFQVGMKSGTVNGFPFVLWLIAGLVPWFYFSDALGNGTNSLIEYQYLVKKIVFNINTLPIVKVFSALFVHLAFILFTILIYSCYGYFPDLYTIQILYYTFCIAVFSLSLVYFTSAAVVFFRDITQIIGVILEVGIWMTPIMWQLNVIPESIRWIFKLNPLYYIVSGYRNALINKVWFWDDIYLTVYFWMVTLLMLLVGTKVFNKLKVHFSDVL